MAEIRTKYLAYVERMLTLAEIPDAAAKAARIFDLEKKIASAHASREDSEDVAQGQQPLGARGLRRQGARPRLGASTSSAAGLGEPGLVRRLAAGRGHGPRGARRLRAARDVEGVPDVPGARRAPRRTSRRPSSTSSSRSTARRSRARRSCATAGSGPSSVTDARPRRGGRPALRREVLPAVREGARRGDGQERDRGVRPPDRPPRLDGARDEGEGEGEARGAEGRRRVPGQVARLLGPRGRAWRRARERAARLALRVPAEPREARPAGRPRRVGHEPAARERREPPGDERPELPGRDAPAAVLRPAAPGRHGLRRRRAP